MLETHGGLVCGGQSGDLGRSRKMRKMTAPDTEFSDDELGMTEQEVS